MGHHLDGDEVRRHAGKGLVAAERSAGILPAESFPENRLAAGEGMLSCILPRLTLTAGTYAMRVVLAEPEGTLLAMFGFEDAPLYFHVASGASAVDNMHEMSGDLVTLAVESDA